MTIESPGELALLQQLLAARNEAADLKRRLEAAVQARDRVEDSSSRQLAQAREALAASGAEVRLLRTSLRFRLGSLLVDSVRSPSSVLALPGRVWRRLRRPRVEAAQAGSSTAGAGTPVIGGLLLRAVPDRVCGPAPAEASELFSLPAPPSAPAAMADLRVAAILDPFSIGSFAPECRLTLLHPDRWQAQLREARPHLLLVESAWLGADGEWQGLVERGSAALRAITASCRRAGIPTVFWNKEDPLHFGAFLDTARLFDHVFTTDASCVPRYRLALGHDRVGLLPFALQPRTHHPVQDEGRVAASMFAGAWYGRMAERCRDFERVADALSLAGPLVIHDRNHGASEPHQRFPARFAASLRPSVPYAQTPALFRRYRIGVNLNTVKDSPTMFARRVLELIGCNTSVYGNRSLALRQLFGDLTVSSDDPQDILAQAYLELRDPDALRFRQRRLAALRKVLKEHCWVHRLGAITQAALGCVPASGHGALWVLARATTADELERVAAAFGRQRGVKATLVLDLGPGLALPDGACGLAQANPADGDWLAVLHPDDHYGPHYLEDLALARSFDQGDALGKAEWLQQHDGERVLRGQGREYRRVECLAIRRCLLRRSRWAGSLQELIDAADQGLLRGEGLVALDALSYGEGVGLEGAADTDGPALAEGVSLVAFEQLLAGMPADADPAAAGADSLCGGQIARLFNLGVMPARTSASASDGRLEICSLLPEGLEDAIFSAPVAVDAVERNGELRACLQAPACAQLDIYLDALDADGRVLRRFTLRHGSPVRAPHIDGTVAYRIAATVRGRFVANVDGIWLGAMPARPLLLPGEGRLLLVCNGYPQDGELYRNAFVHRRVLEYRRRGVDVDVVWVTSRFAQRSYLFDGVLVHVCPPAVLAATLGVSGHAAVAVHFLDAEIWQGIEQAAGDTRTVVWLHGAEIQPWTRRSCNYIDDAEREAAKEASEQRMAFWRGLLASPPQGLHLAFVSRTFAEQCWQDLGIRLPDSRWTVIHNPIDTALYRFEPKPDAQRLRVLSIRPHGYRIYANDLVAATIRRMAQHPDFPAFQFHLVGDGALFEENFAGLEQFSNVRIERRFLRQPEIAELHREAGIFLVPTRGDTQGVSRDEAMASGLVPVTTAAGAVPEFVDEDCGVLVPAEDVEALAGALLSLAADPDRFQALSRAAALRVRRQSDIRLIVDRELDWLGLPCKKEQA
ncbi:hypothetical protein GCM10011521_01080 [Arenimonas soli]|uniref:Spore protein YkvP/CgeB glycosyl transferase-like domain-containing protein n=1 Tax=Arenimonas soli TaxID=2269504 RepID=A0ABQ1H9D7_9GAMM|nr:glycosyltransferase [Arenimonas soli]GGA66720.1 hypothetical protein GCM10011521_01080 [Arenimonas soli]